MKLGDMVLIVGKTGSGKSVEALERVKQFHARNPHTGIVIINPKPVANQWDKLIAPEVRDVPVWKAGRFINWKVRPWQDKELNEFLWSIYTEGEPCLLVFDEGQDIKSHKFPSATAIWRQGREMEISILTCTQRPVDMSRYAISQSKVMSIYNIIGEDDLKALDSYMEVPLLAYIAPSKINRGVITEGKRLKKYNHLLYDVETGKASIELPVEITETNAITIPKKSLPIKTIGMVIAGLIGMRMLL